MRRLTPIYTRTYTLFPYPTLYRSPRHRPRIAEADEIMVVEPEADVQAGQDVGVGRLEIVRRPAAVGNGDQIVGQIAGRIDHRVGTQRRAARRQQQLGEHIGLREAAAVRAVQSGAADTNAGPPATIEQTHL